MAWDVMSGVTKTAWDVMSGVTKTAWDVLSGVANLCGMFCPGCQKMAWDVLSRDVLSGSRPGRKLTKTLCFSGNVMGTETCPYRVLDVNLSRLCAFQEMLWVQRHVPTVSWMWHNFYRPDTPSYQVK